MLVQKANVQLTIEPKELAKYLADGFEKVALKEEKNSDKSADKKSAKINKKDDSADKSADENKSPEK